MQKQRYSTPSWSEYYNPERCEVCGRMMMPAGMDWGKIGADQPANPWLDNWNRTWGDMYDTWMQAVNTSWAPFYPPQQKPVGKHMHRCQGCERDDCDCRCCVSDADLLVHARVGERRVVPLVLENDSHREKQVELELSDWTTHKGPEEIKVSGQLLAPLAFTLAACSEQKVTLVVQTTAGKEDTAAAATAANRTSIGDVDGCQVYYADLRVKGCDIRPVRIALALLSRDCAPLTIDCRCECC